MNDRLRRTFAGYYLAAVDGKATEAIVKAIFGESNLLMVHEKKRKVRRLKNSWKLRTINNMRNYIRKILNEKDESDEPTPTATRFANATAVEVAEALILEMWSIDKFCGVFHHASYVNFAASDYCVLKWCKFLWRDLGARTLLAELHSRKADLALLNDSFDYSHKGILLRWDKYATSSQLAAIRPPTEAVKVIEAEATKKMKKKFTGGGSDDEEDMGFNFDLP
ncbi:hypothetical protein E4U39_003988 [Claviceps sp. Clav50 group G5]|nr:hypothetical protein E4U39_003988 [Claviceps sp. Clav50 group G5]